MKFKFLYGPQVLLIIFRKMFLIKFHQNLKKKKKMFSYDQKLQNYVATNFLQNNNNNNNKKKKKSSCYVKPLRDHINIEILNHRY